MKGHASRFCTRSSVQNVLGLFTKLHRQVYSNLDANSEARLATVRIQEAVLNGDRGRKPCRVEQPEAHVEKACLPVDNERGSADYLILLQGQEVPVITGGNGWFYREEGRQ